MLGHVKFYICILVKYLLLIDTKYVTSIIADDTDNGQLTQFLAVL